MKLLIFLHNKISSFKKEMQNKESFKSLEWKIYFIPKNLPNKIIWGKLL